MARYTEPEPIFISVKEAAKMLGLHVMTVYDLCYDSEIASAKKGKRRLVELASVKEYAARLLDEAASA